MIRTLLVASLLIGSGVTGFAAGPGERLIEINGYLLVYARINGQGPFLFLLDTGATSSAVTPAVARAAGLIARSRVAVATAAGEALAPVVEAEIRVGSVTAASAEVLIMPLDQPRRIDSRIEGVLGQSFLSRLPCLIDYRARRFWLGDDAVQRAAAMPFKFTAQRLEGRLALAAELDAGRRPLHLVLDSGAPALVLTCGKNCPELKERTEGALATNAGSRKMVLGTLAAVSVGGIRIRRPRTVLVDGDPVGSGEDGLLPLRWFSAVYLGPANTVALAR